MKGKSGACRRCHKALVDYESLSLNSNILRTHSKCEANPALGQTEKVMPWIIRVLLFSGILATVRVVNDSLFVPAAIVLAIILNPFSVSAAKNKEADHDKS